MRNDAPFLVRRRAHMIGRPETAERTTVAYRAYTLEHALAWAQNERRIVVRLIAQGAPWARPARLWIEAAGQPAILKK